MRALLQHPIAAVFALLAAVIVAAMTFAIVPETQQAVVLRLNNPQRVVNQWQPGQTIGNSGAGLIARVPLIDSIVWLDKRVLDADLDNTLVLSTDQLRLNVDAFARFRIVNPLRAVTSTGSTSNTEERVADQLRPLLGTALRNELGKVPFSSLLSPERGRVMDLAEASAEIVALSAATGEGLDRLVETIVARLSVEEIVRTIALQPEDGRLRAWLFEHGRVHSEEADEGRTRLSVGMSERDWGRFRRLRDIAGESEE